MPAQLLAMSHSPLLNVLEPPRNVLDELHGAFDHAREFVKSYNPDLVVLFWPDHYNGFFYDLMPPYCVGYECVSVGDWGGQVGQLNVPTELAEELAQFIISQDIDVAISRRMEIDHGGVQPLEVIYGDIEGTPVIPIFVNGVARPFVSMKRVRAMGEAVGRFFAQRDERVLFMASGGLSHDPPVPQWATATEEQKALLLNGRHPTEEARQAREQNVINNAVAFAKGEAPIQDLNPEWDAAFMEVCASNDPAGFDSYTADEMDQQAGHSSHEVRTWVAAFSALAAAHPDAEVRYQYYRPIKEFIAGFGIMAKG
ncbi:2,3-dihydroxyphenylpropionate/2,3-dihydroxicinnamic acid 1,2-dioxygenase [Corynebacterium ciconiae DSM 44920]|uniref:3-carboxyethylcatechol 2,3-dioxygenase n=1 Tax=Corynebacterium ciconiae TaxID=227319 RepID=UPI000475AFC2|nr:3-carboxyethylcatechol 2,3-dioxygenase [Corynebacterium ciconiae]WKD61588.1 2,3-dihydroxyphenylpropionate/2,3-dihydroxicinnamic acid 1,2-dioxygenase [Corynebacterium ciconiae DSM 44920]